MWMLPLFFRWNKFLIQREYWVTQICLGFSSFSLHHHHHHHHHHYLLLLLFRQWPVVKNLTIRLIWEVPAGSPSRGGNFASYVLDINKPSLPTPFYSVLESVSDFMALSTVFHSINYTDILLLSHSVLVVFFLPYWSAVYLFMKVSIRPDKNLCGWLGLKHWLN